MRAASSGSVSLDGDFISCDSLPASWPTCCHWLRDLGRDYGSQATSIAFKREDVEDDLWASGPAVAEFLNRPKQALGNARDSGKQPGAGRFFGQARVSRSPATPARESTQAFKAIVGVSLGLVPWPFLNGLLADRVQSCLDSR